MRDDHHRHGPDGLVLIAAALWLIAAPTQGGVGPALLPPVIGAAEVFAGDALSGLGLRGFDPVSYHLEGGPRAGRADTELVWGGAAWRFASEANRTAFARDPDAYAPRLGGHDAEAAARGLLVQADAGTYAIRDGRLYLFRTPESRSRFLAEPALAAAAEGRWPALRRQLVPN